ncbi:immunoglobulin A1 protease autotransporter [Patella vulgata]|uniref:immunoglobulin A1 protease autotransporter n=1 Tax=Patella vulgata TaxID=6465 RepID=UPI00217F5A60|nr:immunoglobulin A1 protease autotransporter [Patella vulgata]
MSTSEVENTPVADQVDGNVTSAPAETEATPTTEVTETETAKNTDIETPLTTSAEEANNEDSENPSSEETKTGIETSELAAEEESKQDAEAEEPKNKADESENPETVEEKSQEATIAPESSEVNTENTPKASEPSEEKTECGVVNESVVEVECTPNQTEDTTDGPNANPTAEEAKSRSSSIKDVDAAVEELLQDKELIPREKTPPVENTDERAEDGVVVAIVPVDAASENRSKDAESESRGEDRTEGPKSDPETRGDEDTGGEQSTATSLGDQGAQKEAIQKLIDDKTLLEKDFFSLKSQLDTLKIDYSKMELEVEAVNTSRKEQDDYIKTLECDVTKLKKYEDWGKNNEEKINDVQSKLKSLAEVEEGKNQKIVDLEKQLIVAKDKLDQAEKNIEDNEASNTRADDEKPKSRTCTIM